MFRSLQSRLFLTYLFASGLVLLLVGLSLMLILLRSPVAEERMLAQLNASMPLILQRAEGRLLLRLPQAELQATLDRIDLAADARILIIRSDGEVLADSRPLLADWPLEARLSIAASNSAGQGSIRSDDRRTWVYIARPLGGEHVLVLAQLQPVLLSLRTWGDDLLLRPLLQAGGVALLMAVLLSFLISRWVAAPLDRLAHASMQIAEGHYEAFDPGGPEEVRSLGRTINEMAGRMQASQQAQRDFVANVSHELKTPLTSIQGFAQAILDGTVDDHQGREHAAGVIYAEANRLRRLVEDLLELARFDSGQMRIARERVDLQVLLGSLEERLSVRAEEAQVQLTFEIPRPTLIVGDGDRLAQVFTNLVDNAIKHTPPGGTVRVWGEQAQGWISIHVDDSGSGIPADELSRIFERFYQLDKARPGGGERGAGLGLAIAREIVVSHGGRLTAQSEVGRGSRFTVQLPVIRPDDKTIVSSRS